MSAERTVDRRRKSAYYRAEHMQACRALAMAQARADRSDPFTYSRVMSHLLDGAAEMDDYTLEWQAKQHRTAQGAEYVLMVPINVRRM